MRYIEGDISLELANILDKKLGKLLGLIFEFNSEIIGEITCEFPSIVTVSKELNESLIEKIELYSEMFVGLKISEGFSLEIDRNLSGEFNNEVSALIAISYKLAKGIENSSLDELENSISEFEDICKEYNEEIILVGDYDSI